MKGIKEHARHRFLIFKQLFYTLYHYIWEMLKFSFQAYEIVYICISLWNTWWDQASGFQIKIYTAYKNFWWDTM